MKTKITLLIGAVALITLSFTFASVDTPKASNTHHDLAKIQNDQPVGGIISDEVVK